MCIYIYTHICTYNACLYETKWIHTYIYTMMNIIYIDTHICITSLSLYNYICIYVYTDQLIHVFRTDQQAPLGCGSSTRAWSSSSPCPSSSSSMRRQGETRDFKQQKMAILSMKDWDVILFNMT